LSAKYVGVTLVDMLTLILFLIAAPVLIMSYEYCSLP